MPTDKTSEFGLAFESKMEVKFQKEDRDLTIYGCLDLHDSEDEDSNSSYSN